MSKTLVFLIILEGVTVIALGLDWLLGFPFWPYVLGDVVIFAVLLAWIIRKIGRALA